MIAIADADLRAAAYHGIDLVLGVRLLRILRADRQFVHARAQSGGAEKLEIRAPRIMTVALKGIEIEDAHGRPAYADWSLDSGTARLRSG